MNIENMTKEELELLSHLDIANCLLEKTGGLTTKEIFSEIVRLLELNNDVFEKKIGNFYTSMTTDKRFIILEDGKWDLKKRYTSDKILKDLKDLEDEDEEVEEDIEIEEAPEEDNIDAEDDSENLDDNDDGLEDLVVVDADELEEE